MSPHADPAECLLGRLVDIHRSRRPLVLMTDYDGTLTPFAPHPSWARLSAEVRRTLARLAACPDVFVGIVSGRSINDLKEIVSLPGLYYAGTSGLELDLLGCRTDHPRAALATAHLDEWHAKLRDVIAPFVGAWIERKPLGMTVHYRQIDGELRDALRSNLRRALAQVGGNPKLSEVSLGLEVTPDLGWDKGTALELILEDAARDAVPVFAGAAADDLDAMRAARRRGGFAIGIGPDVPREADYHLPSPDAFASVLTRISKKISAR